MHPDMKRMYHKACWFPAHHAFGENASNPGVFTKCALPLVKAVSYGDGVGTLFMYGQTGSGKTHTMTGIEEGVAMSLSQLLHPDDPNHTMSDDTVTVRLRFFELVGKRCVDLIANKAGVELKLMNDGNDAVRPAGAAEPIVDSASHLLSLLKLGKKRRATAPTDVNGGSSRSHAVCQIEVTMRNKKSTSGLLTLVDCAGSERKEDSMYHDKERQRESTEINASLYALKECVRARALAAKGKNVQIPFRSSSLTKVLMESFVRTDAHLAVIATVSPIPTDTEHSISTLRTVCAIAGYNDSDMIEEKQEVKPNLPKREERIPPIKWTSEQLFAWVRSVSNGRFASVANEMPKGTTGKVVMRWGAAQFSAICGGPKIGGALQRLLQEERARCEQLEQLKRQDRLG
jgi:kinesin family protein 2/24